MARSLPARSGLLALLALAVLLLAPVGPWSPVSRAGADAVTGQIQGASSVGVALQSTYFVTATGGPAIAANGTQVGILSYKSSFSAVNTTGIAFTPTSGVLVNGSVTLEFTAPNVTESVTLYVLVNSTLANTSTTTNLSDTIQIVQPFRFNANLQVGSSAGVAAFSLTVLLDGAPVGAIKVPSLSAGAAYPISFPYVPAGGLSAGWHTFSVSLAQEHGLVTFPGGLTAYSSSFYVAGPAPDYTIYYLTGITLVLVVIVIYSTLTGRRRPRRSKK